MPKTFNFPLWYALVQLGMDADHAFLVVAGNEVTP